MSVPDQTHIKPLSTHLNPGQLLPTPLCLNQVHPQMYRRLSALRIGTLLSSQHHHILQPFDINLIRRALAAKEIRQHALGDRVLILHSTLPRRARKHHHRPQANGRLLALELLQHAKTLRIQVQLQHVEDFPAKGPRKRETVGTLFRAAAKDEKRGIVFFRKEFERRGVFKGVDGVLFGEFLGEGLAQGKEVGEGVLGDLRAGGAAEEEDGFGVLDGFWGALLEGPLGAGITRFSRGQSLILACPFPFSS